MVKAAADNLLGELCMSQEKIFGTDVLVIGGGIAGCVAALKAKEQGVDVNLVDTGYIGRSGQTPNAGAMAVLRSLIS
jgi:succinate dehydrogenase/fumarate reductase flavoprotein subunit